MPNNREIRLKFALLVMAIAAVIASFFVKSTPEGNLYLDNILVDPGQPIGLGLKILGSIGAIIIAFFINDYFLSNQEERLKTEIGSIIGRITTISLGGPVEKVRGIVHLYYVSGNSIYPRYWQYARVVIDVAAPHGFLVGRVNILSEDDDSIPYNIEIKQFSSASILSSTPVRKQSHERSGIGVFVYRSPSENLYGAFWHEDWNSKLMLHPAMILSSGPFLGSKRGVLARWPKITARITDPGMISELDKKYEHNVGNIGNFDSLLSSRIV